MIKKILLVIGVVLIGYLIMLSWVNAREAEKQARVAKKYHDSYQEVKERNDSLRIELEKCQGLVRLED